MNNQIERWLSSEEEKKLLASSPEWLRQIVQFALNTGLRQGEILGLKWPQVHLSRRTFTILATREAKIGHFRFHDLRHTFATRLVQAGVDVYTIQKIGSWKSISMVMRYAHHYPESLRSGADELDKIQKKVSTNLAQSKKKGITDSSKKLCNPLISLVPRPRIELGTRGFSVRKM